MQVVAQLSVQDLPDDVRVLSPREREALSEPFEASVRFVCADPYLTQWKESAFTQADDGQVLVLGDGPEGFPPIDGEASVHPLCEWRAPLAGLCARGSLSGWETR